MATSLIHMALAGCVVTPAEKVPASHLSIMTRTTGKNIVGANPPLTWFVAVVTFTEFISGAHTQNLGQCFLNMYVAADLRAKCEIPQ